MNSRIGSTASPESYMGVVRLKIKKPKVFLFTQYDQFLSETGQLSGKVHNSIRARKALINDMRKEASVNLDNIK